jgi:hypothetical protein
MLNVVVPSKWLLGFSWNVIIRFLYLIDTQNKNTQLTHSAQSVIMLSVIMLIVIMLSVIMLSVIMLGAIMLSGIYAEWNN